MKVVGFVPIKLNSERLPMKNVKKFTNGEPLISYILDTLLKVKELDEIYVYCSDEKIQDYLPQNVKFLQRDKYYDLSSTSFNEVLSSFTEIIDADVYVLAHATAPMIQPASISKAVKKLLNEDYDSAFTVTRIQEFLWKDNMPFNYSLDAIPRTQDLPEMYVETCGLYVFKNHLMKQEKRRIGNKPYLLEVSKIEAIDINNPEDFIIADAVFNYLKTRGEEINDG